MRRTRHEHRVRGGSRLTRSAFAPPRGGGWLGVLDSQFISY